MNERSIIALVESFKPNGNAYDTWHFYQSLKKVAETKQKEYSVHALSEVEANNGYVTSSFGGVQRVKKTTNKPKESLKFYLQDNGVLDLCRKDEIDLNKVNELIKAGKLSEEAFEHIDTSEIYYLKEKSGGKA